ncbi:hypothetical protein BH11PLA1_BH11PLA1_15470 [soil metagenome]
MRTTQPRHALLAAAALLAASAGALAQPSEDSKKRIEPPELKFTQKDNGVSFLSTVGMLGVGILVIAANFIPVKRGHQD